jgi:membrane associated rhomboid family serine protease
MLSDRSYMRDDYARPKTAVTTWIICATIAGFVIQNIAWKWLGPSTGRGFDHTFALSVQGIQSGYFWTFATYSLLHSMSSFLHLVFNLLWIFLLGRELLPLLGGRQFMWLYAGGVFLGGVAWLATNWTHGGQLIGASAGAYALLMMFAANNPNRPITLLLFFIVPVTIKPKWIVIVLGAIDLFGFLFSEITGGNNLGGIAHSAHLGGFAAGWLFFRYVFQRNWKSSDRATPSIELPGWLKRAKKRPSQAAAYKVNVDKSASPAGAHPDLKAEVDRILDKINSHGFGALTDDEKRVLDKAKDLLNKR